MRPGHSLCHGGVGADFCGRIMPVGRCQQREAALIDESLFYPTNIVRSPLPLCLRDRHSSEEQNSHSNVTMGHDDVSQCELLGSLGGLLASLLGNFCRGIRTSRRAHDNTAVTPSSSMRVFPLSF